MFCYCSNWRRTFYNHEYTLHFILGLNDPNKGSVYLFGSFQWTFVRLKMHTNMILEMNHSNHSSVQLCWWLRRNMVQLKTLKTMTLTQWMILTSVSFNYFGDLDKNWNCWWTLKSHRTKEEIKQKLWSVIMTIRKRCPFGNMTKHHIRND